MLSYIYCYEKSTVSTEGEIQKITNGCVYDFVLDPKTISVISINFGPLHETATSWFWVDHSNKKSFDKEIKYGEW